MTNALPAWASMALSPVGYPITITLSPDVSLIDDNARPGTCGDALLDVRAVEFEMAELGVRHQHAVGEQRRAHARAERQHHLDAAPSNDPAQPKPKPVRLDLERLDLTVEEVEERIRPGETNVFDK